MPRGCAAHVICSYQNAKKTGLLSRIYFKELARFSPYEVDFSASEERSTVFCRLRETCCMVAMTRLGSAIAFHTSIWCNY